MTRAQCTRHAGGVPEGSPGSSREAGRTGVRVHDTIRTPEGCQREGDARFPLAPLRGANNSGSRFRESPAASPGYLLASLRDAGLPIRIGDFRSRKRLHGPFPQPSFYIPPFYVLRSLFYRCAPVPIDGRKNRRRIVTLGKQIRSEFLSCCLVVEEPRADWTDAAQKNFRAALAARGPQLGARVIELGEAQLDEFAELLALHRAVAEAVFMHHSRAGRKLPTKRDRLDWSLGDAVAPLHAKTGADYALFTWIRDSYASSERKAAMFAMALLGAVSFGGSQVGYASLVDLRTGRIVWFNDLDRMSGDLREAAAARETVDTLLERFPSVP